MQPNDRDQLDELLDGALKRYGEVEPRAGLEGRVLARLAGSERVHRGGWRVWTFAGAAAVVLAVGLWIALGFRSVTSPRPVVRGTSAMAATATQSVPPVVEAAGPPRRTLKHRQLTAARHREPRLDHFPSEREPNTQELLLVNYVEQFPEQAKLIAQEQKRFEEETRKVEQEFQLQQDR